MICQPPVSHRTYPLLPTTTRFRSSCRIHSGGMLRCRPISPAAAAEPAMSIAIGIVVGLILALTGAGGTIVAVPLLMFGLHLEVATAAPIALQIGRAHV